MLRFALAGDVFTSLDSETHLGPKVHSEEYLVHRTLDDWQPKTKSIGEFYAKLITGIYLDPCNFFESILISAYQMSLKQLSGVAKATNFLPPSSLATIWSWPLTMDLPSRLWTLSSIRRRQQRRRASALLDVPWTLADCQLDVLACPFPSHYGGPPGFRLRVSWNNFLPFIHH